MTVIETVDTRADAPAPGDIKAQIIRIRQGMDRPLPGTGEQRV